MALALALLTAGCAGGQNAEDPKEGASQFELEARGLSVGDSQDQVRHVLGEPDQKREWAVTVPWWGPGESLANVLPLGSPVVTWSYEVEGLVYYFHFDAAKAGSPLLGVEVYPEGAVF